MKDKEIINNLENISILRKERNITQNKLATDMEVSQELISRYEIGSSFPQPNMLIKLADYFNCSVDYLLARTDVRSSIKDITEKQNNGKAIDLYNKYNSLSNEDKKYFDRFLSFLTSNTEE